MKQQPKNIKEFKELIERYESITLEEIKEAFKNRLYVAKYLTGFRHYKSCTLCVAVKKECNDCVYNEFIGCSLIKSLQDSFNRIYMANTPLKLKNAYRNRAKVLREFSKNNNIKID